MIVLFGVDWGEWSTHATAWSPVIIPDAEVAKISRIAKDMIWPHHEALYLTIPVQNITVGDCIGESFSGRSGIDNFRTAKNKAGEEVLFSKQKVYRSGHQYLSLEAEARIFEDGSFVLCLRVDLKKSSARGDHSFIEYAYNEENERWESIMKHNGEYPYHLIDEIERFVEKMEGYNHL
jgi:hypothetical protein